MDVLRTQGVARTRIDDIAAASGVPKSSIYRRWPGLRHLVVDAMAAATAHDKIESTADAVTDLRTLATRIAATLTGPDGAALLHLGVEIMGDDRLSADYRARIVDPHRDLAVTIVERGQEQGVFRSDLDARLVIDGMMGALVYRVVVLHEHPSADDVATLIDATLRILTDASG